MASAGGDLVEVRRLLAAGARVNERGKDGFTALIYAAAFNHEDVAAALLEAGARTTLRTAEGETALSIAAAKGFWPLVMRIARAFSRMHACSAEE